MSERPIGEQTTDAEEAPRGWWAGRGELVVAALLIALALVLVYGNLTMNVVGEGGLLGPQGFGWLVAAICVAVAATLTVGAFRKPEDVRRVAAAEAKDTNWGAMLSAFAGLLAFTALLEFLGWLIAATLLFGMVATALGNRRVLWNLLVGFILAGVIQIVFGGVLGLALPAGLLDRW